MAMICRYMYDLLGLPYLSKLKATYENTDVGSNYSVAISMVVVEE